MNTNGNRGAKDLICNKCGSELYKYAEHIYVCNNCGNVLVDIYED